MKTSKAFDIWWRREVLSKIGQYITPYQKRLYRKTAWHGWKSVQRGKAKKERQNKNEQSI